MSIDLTLLLGFMEALNFVHKVAKNIYSSAIENKEAINKLQKIVEEAVEDAFNEFITNFRVISQNATSSTLKTIYGKYVKKGRSLFHAFLQYFHENGVAGKEAFIYAKILEALYINALNKKFNSEKELYMHLKNLYLPKYFEKIEGTKKFIKVVKLLNKGKFNVPPYYDKFYKEIFDDNEQHQNTAINLYGTPLSGKSLLLSYAVYKHLLKNINNNKNHVLVLYFAPITKIDGTKDGKQLIEDLRKTLTNMYGKIYVVVDNANRLSQEIIADMISSIEDLGDEDIRVVKLIFISRYPLKIPDHKINYINLPYTYINDYYIKIIKHILINCDKTLMESYIKKLRKLSPNILYEIQSELYKTTQPCIELYKHTIMKKQVQQIISSIVGKIKSYRNKYLAKILEAILSLSLAKIDIPLSEEFFENLIEVPKEEKSLFKDAYDKIMSYLVDSRKSIFEVILDRDDEVLKIRIINYNDEIIVNTLKPLSAKKPEEIELMDINKIGYTILNYLTKYIDIQCYQNNVYSTQCLDKIIDRIHERGYIEIVIKLLRYILNKLNEKPCYDAYCTFLKIHYKNKLIAEESRSSYRSIGELAETYENEILNNIEVLEGYLKRERASAYYGLARIYSRKVALVLDSNIALKMLRKGKKYYEMAEKEFIDLKNNFMVANIKHGYGIIELRECILKEYLIQENKERMKKCMEKAIKHLEESNIQLMKILEELKEDDDKEKIEKTNRAYGYNLAKIGQILFFIGEYNRALKNYNEAYLIGQEVGDTLLEYIAKSGKLLSLIELTNKLNELELIDNELEQLYKLCVIRGDNRCLNYYKKVYIHKQLKEAELGGQITCSEITSYVDELQMQIKHPEDLVYLKNIEDKLRKVCPEHY